MEVEKGETILDDKSLTQTEELHSQYRFEAKTVQASPFRVLSEALKDILTDGNLEIDETGMKLISMDNTHTVLVHLRLEAANFEHFHCHERMVLGLNMMNYHKLIKTMSNSDNLTLFMEKDDPNHMGIKIENGEKNTITVYKLNLMDLCEESISIPPATFASVITMPSGDFQKICRDRHNLAELIEIKSVGSQLIFNCHGDFASQETVIGESSGNGMSFVKRQEKEEIVQGVFALKHLCLFTKCTNLCNTIEMYLKNDYPLIICYSVANLGQIKLCLAPQCQNEGNSGNTII